MSRAYVHAVAAIAGMGCSFFDFDYGIDMTVHEVTLRGNRRVFSGFKVDIQLKSTMNARVEQGNVVYSLEKKTYDDLITTNVGTPRILVVLLMPEDEMKWLAQSDEELVFRGCAYWVSLLGQPPLPNVASATIRIPVENRFSGAALRKMMDSVRTGVPL